jgi:hypothetical protein
MRSLSFVGTVLCLICLAIQGCEKERVSMTTAVSQEPSKPRISSDQALKAARLDAERAYRDLSQYRVTIVIEDDGWHIDYELKNPDAQGGGPHYIVDSATGVIVSKQYAQ